MIQRTQATTEPQLRLTDRQVYDTTKATMLGRLLGRQMSRTRVLNVGGGGGFLGVWCAEHGAQVTMVDSDPDSLDAARLLARHRGVDDRLRLICTEEFPLELAGQRFDLVIAKNILEDVADDGALLRHLADCQAPGGRLLLSTQNRWSLNYLLEGTYHRWWCREKDWCGWHPRHRRFYTPPALRARLKAAGYTPNRWAGVFILPYNVLTWFSLLRRRLVVPGLRWFDLGLGDVFPFNRLGWNMLVVAERAGPRSRAIAVGAPERPAAARTRVVARSVTLRRQPPVYSPVMFGDIARAASQAVGGPDPRPALAASLRDQFSADTAVLASSGTHALQVALVAASRHADGTRRVALPAYSCYDVAAAAVGVGAEIDLYDVDPATLGPDLDSLAASLAAGTRIVVVSPLWGVPVDWKEIESCASAFGAVVVEDAAQGHGASWNGRALGSLGSMSVLSFGRGKGWTGAGGGAVLFRGEQAETNLDWLGEPGGLGFPGEVGIMARALAQRALGNPLAYALPAMLPWLHLGETRYAEPGPVAAMSRATAAILQCGRGQAALEALNRRLNADFLLQQLPSSVHIRRVKPPAGSEPGYLRLPIMLSRGLADFRNGGALRRLGVSPGYPRTLGTLAAVRRQMAGAGGSWPGAEQLVRRLVTLPTHSLLTPRDRADLLQVLAAYPD